MLLPCPSPPRPARRGACWPYARACPADSPNIPSAAARSCRLPAVLRPPRERLAPRLERHESGAAGLRAERPSSAQPRIASMPTALPRRPKQARAMFIPFYAADARPAACALADPKQRGRDGRAAVFLVPGLKLRALRVGAALLSPPSSRLPPSKTLSKREAVLVARNTMCSNQSRRLAEINRD